MADDFASAIYSSLSGIKSAAFRAAEVIDEKSDHLADAIRGKLSSSTWLPPNARPHPPSVSVHPQPPNELASRTTAWAWENRLAVGIAGATTLGLGTYIYTLRRSSRSRKRRAKRAPNGARKEVLVLAGSPHDAITKSLAVDLERRGFIVFVVVNSMDDEQLVLALGGRDIRPLSIDLLDPAGADAALARFETHLTLPVSAFAGAQPHHLHLAGMILVPDAYFPIGPIETIAADVWSDVLNLRLLSPFITAKLFVRLLRTHQSRLLVLSPAITRALTPAFHAPETVAVAALDAFTRTLRRELKPLGVDVAMLRLGTFDLSASIVAGRNHLQNPNGARADLVSWSAAMRGAYGRSYAAQEGRRAVRGSPLRELHHAVFDVIAADGRVKAGKRVGSGSFVYELFARVAPEGLVDWMLGGGRADPVVIRGDGTSEGSGSEESVDWEKVDKNSV